MLSLRKSLIALAFGVGAVGVTGCVSDGYYGRNHDGRHGYHGRQLYHDRDHYCEGRRDSDCYDRNGRRDRDRDRRHRHRR